MIRQYWHYIQRHLFLLTFILVAGIAISLALHHRLPKVFQATGFVKLSGGGAAGGGGGSPMSLLAGMTGGGGGSGGGGVSTEMLNVVMGSPSFQDLIYKDLIAAGVPESRFNLPGHGMADIMQAVSLQASKNDPNILSFKAVAENDRNLPVWLVNALLKRMVVHICNQSTQSQQESIGIIASLQQDNDRKMESLSQDILAWIKTHGRSVLPEKIAGNDGAIIARIQGFQQKLLETEFAQKSMTVRLRDLEKRFGIEGIAPERVFWVNLSDPNEQRLKSLIVRHGELLSRYPEDSPLLKPVLDELVALKKTIRPANHEELHLVEMDATEAPYSAEISRLRSSLASSEDEKKELTRQIEDLRKALTDTPPALVDYQKLLAAQKYAQGVGQELGMQLERQRILRATTPEPAAILEAASGVVTISRGRMFFLAMGICGALAFSILSIIVLYQWDDTMHCARDFAKHFRLPLLAIHTTWKSGGLGRGRDAMRMREAFEELKTHLHEGPWRGPRRCLMVASALPGEGKSFVSLRLAHAYAEDGQGVVLVMGDLRKPLRDRDLSFLPHASSSPGLADLLNDKVQANAVVHAVKDTPHLWVVPPGTSCIHSPALLKQPRFGRFITMLTARFPVVIIDTPAILPVSDYASVVPQADGVLMIVRAAKTPVGVVRQALQKLRRTNAPLLGVMMNQAHQRDLKSDYYYHDYGPYQEGRKEKAGRQRPGSTSGADNPSTEASSRVAGGRAVVSVLLLALSFTCLAGATPMSIGDAKNSGSATRQASSGATSSLGDATGVADKPAAFRQLETSFQAWRARRMAFAIPTNRAEAEPEPARTSPGPGTAPILAGNAERTAAQPPNGEAGRPSTAAAVPPAPQPTVGIKGTDSPAPVDGVPPPPAEAVPPEDYRLKAGDRVEISVWGEPAMTRDTIVRPDGKISYIFIDDVYAVGLTFVELKLIIAERLKPFIRTPIVSVLGRSFEGNFVSILGAVKAPGRKVIYSGDRLLDVISNAQGLRYEELGGSQGETANLKSAYLSRNGQLMPVDFSALIYDGDMTQNVLVEVGDFIYIPSSIGMPIFITGELARPMAMPYSGNPTLLEAITKAGGITSRGKEEDIKILRGGLLDPVVLTCSFPKIVDGSQKNPSLEPGDIIYIPPTTLTRVERYSSQVIPFLNSIIMSRSAKDSIRTW